jgi:hypothetical protein
MIAESITGIVSAHAKSILFTFEIFWILIFLLERLGGQTGSGIPQFIYVNF